MLLHPAPEGSRDHRDTFYIASVESGGSFDWGSVLSPHLNNERARVFHPFYAIMSTQSGDPTRELDNRVLGMSLNDPTPPIVNLLSSDRIYGFNAFDMGPQLSQKIEWIYHAIQSVDRADAAAINNNNNNNNNNNYNNDDNMDVD
jgi:hypothetical protein